MTCAPQEEAAPETSAVAVPLPTWLALHIRPGDIQVVIPAAVAPEVASAAALLLPTSLALHIRPGDIQVEIPAAVGPEVASAAALRLPTWLALHTRQADIRVEIPAAAAPVAASAAALRLPTWLMPRARVAEIPAVEVEADGLLRTRAVISIDPKVTAEDDEAACATGGLFSEYPSQPRGDIGDFLSTHRMRHRIGVPLHRVSFRFQHPATLLAE
jgi:hypothetical protein